MKEKIQAFMAKRQAKGKRSYEIDMCNGPLLGKILRFAVSLMLSGVLQLFFNAADIVVVGRFTGHTALAAVGSTGALINLLINVFVGLSIGTNVLVARYYGAQDAKQLSETVHTSVLTSLVSGVILIAVGVAFAEPLLTLMGTPEDVLGQAALYMRIYFVGMPAMMLYNFGAAILRSVGDTKRPLYFLTIAGVVNVILNLFFVIVFHLGVAGVAIATVISQVISAGLVTICLMKTNASYRLELHKLHIYKDKFFGMMRVGLPAGMQGAVFSISNVLIQSSINSFGSTVMAGSTAAANIEGFVYTAMNAFYQTALSFTGQNMGAKKYDRVAKILRICILCVTVTGVVLGCGAYLLGTPLLSIYTSDPGGYPVRFGAYAHCVRTVLPLRHYGHARGRFARYGVFDHADDCIAYRCVCAACGVVLTVFQMHRTLFILFLSYPVTWAVTAAAHFVCYLIVHHKMMEKAKAEQAEAAKA